jgi:Protein of unknown function (DUF2789)
MVTKACATQAADFQGVAMPAKSMTDLFNQLGLPSDEASIQVFIAQNDGVCRHCGLVQAVIWSDSQRNFLKEAVAEDADWSLPAETLTAALSR